MNFRIDDHFLNLAVEAYNKAYPKSHKIKKTDIKSLYFDSTFVRVNGLPVRWSYFEFKN